MNTAALTNAAMRNAVCATTPTIVALDATATTASAPNRYGLWVRTASPTARRSVPVSTGAKYRRAAPSSTPEPPQKTRIGDKSKPWQHGYLFRIC